MAVTFHHMARLFIKLRWSVTAIATRYNVTNDYVENAIRKVMWRKR